MSRMGGMGGQGGMSGGMEGVGGDDGKNILVHMGVSTAAKSDAKM